VSHRSLYFFINKNATIKNLLTSLIISTGICISIFISPATYSAQIIANANVTVLTQSKLRRIFTMRQRYWSDKQKIIVFVLPSAHPLHQRFSKNLFRFRYCTDSCSVSPSADQCGNEYCGCYWLCGRYYSNEGEICYYN